MKCISKTQLYVRPHIQSIWTLDMEFSITVGYHLLRFVEKITRNFLPFNSLIFP